ncbi:hypothetical protein Tco_0474786 [Tanacetum coccineum]
MERRNDQLRESKAFSKSTLRNKRHFLSDDEGSDRKMTWISWKRVLASKKNGDLGVSSFFDFNCALLFKWVRRFLSHGSSLWSRFIKAMYGEIGALDTFNSLSRPSPWLDTILEIFSLTNNGIDLLPFVRKMVGNGANSLFWFLLSISARDLDDV